MTAKKKILLTGANGFIGRHLVHDLLERGETLRCLYRTPPEQLLPQVETMTGDLLKPETLPGALAGIDTAYYMVHSLNASHERFRDLDRQAATNFTEAADRAGVRRVIYLSGLGERGKKLSDHLDSRSEVAEILCQGNFQTTVLRAAIIVGAGGASFELLRYLVKTQIFLLDAPHLETRCQPIGLDDVRQYLVGCLDEDRTTGHCYDIGGPEILSYRELLDRFAKVAGTVNIYLPVPKIPPKLVGIMTGLLSRQNGTVVAALIEGLGNEVVCQENLIREILPIPLTPLDVAIAKALKEIPRKKRSN